MKVLSVRRRYYKNRTAWEDFDVLYKGKRVEDGTEYILVREQAEGHISSHAVLFLSLIHI